MKYIRLYEQVEFSDRIRMMKKNLSSFKLICSGDILTKEEEEKISKCKFKLDDWVIFSGADHKVEPYKVIIIDIEDDTLDPGDNKYYIINDRGDGYWVAAEEIEKLSIDIDLYRSTSRYNL